MERKTHWTPLSPTQNWWRIYDLGYWFCLFFCESWVFPAIYFLFQILDFNWALSDWQWLWFKSHSQWRTSQIFQTSVGPGPNEWKCCQTAVVLDHSESDPTGILLHHSGECLIMLGAETLFIWIGLQLVEEERFATIFNYFTWAWCF